MNGFLVILHGNSGSSAKVAAMLATLETAMFVILPNVSRQRIERLEGLGAMTTAPLGQATMLIAAMVPQLMPKQK